jgi:RecJ-like exonuclease
MLHPDVFCLIAFIFWVLVIWKRDQKRQRAHEKVIELTEKGYDTKICSKCDGHGGNILTWTGCAGCGGLGYIYKLKEGAKGPPNTDNKGRP